MRRSRFRTSLCIATFAGLVAIAPTADAKPDKKLKGTFTALTYNVAGLPEAISGSEPTTNSPLIGDKLNGYDLVLLQENWGDHLHDQREAGLVGDDVPPVMYHHLVVRDARHPFRSQPAPHPYVPDLRRAPKGPPTISDGLNRLSQFTFDGPVRVMWEDCHGELSMSGVEAFLGATGLDDQFRDNGLGVINDETDGGAADCGAQKGFSVARTELAPGVTVDVYNLHADAGSHARDVAARAANFAQLTAFINEYSAGRAVILGGDTNLKIDREDRIVDAQVWADFRRDTGLSDVCDTLDCGADDAVIDKFAFRSGGGVKLSALTHAFQRDVFVRSDGESLSDHDALAVEFRWMESKR